MLKKVLISAFLASTLSFKTYSQLIPTDSLQVQTEAAIDLSNEFIQQASHLYNGFEYVNYDNQTEGHQFFESAALDQGSLIYNGIMYRNVPMLYDIVRDELAIEHFYKYYKIRLISEQVSQFTLFNHTFFRIIASNQDGIRTGFYEKLYDGEVQVLAKRSKQANEEIVNHRVKRWFVQKDRYYLYKDNTYYEVKNKKGAIRILNDRKKEIRKFIQENRAQFNSLEQALVGISRYYDGV